jgi:hypothetical protein
LHVNSHAKFPPLEQVIRNGKQNKGVIDDLGSDTRGILLAVGHNFEARSPRQQTEAVADGSPARPLSNHEKNPPAE